MFKVGDKVYCKRVKKSGVIAKIYEEGNYPVVTSFGKSYTVNGKEYIADKTPCLIIKQVFTPPAGQPTTQYSITYSTTHVFIDNSTIYPLTSAFVVDHKLMCKYLLTPEQLQEFIQHISPQIKELT